MFRVWLTPISQRQTHGGIPSQIAQHPRQRRSPYCERCRGIGTNWHSRLCNEAGEHLTLDITVRLT